MKGTTGHEQHEEDDDDSRMPCPILEFRLINTMWNQKDGAIMNATVNLVVSRLATAAEECVAKDLSNKKRKRKNRRTTSSSASAKTSPRHHCSLTESAVAAIAVSGNAIQRLNNNLISSAAATAKALTLSRTNSNTAKDEEAAAFNEARREARRLSRSASIIVPDEGGDGHFGTTRSVFERLDVVTDRHPFFRRQWTIRHVCNQDSPLLPNLVRDQIRENNGFWPSELNKYEEVRKSINFNEIIVSFSGTAHASGSAVFALNVYTYVDMVVGYTFADVVYKEKDGKLAIDELLLNDVTEQEGGGAEPLYDEHVPEFSGYFAVVNATPTTSEEEDFFVSSTDITEEEELTNNNSTQGDLEEFVFASSTENISEEELPTNNPMQRHEQNGCLETLE